MWCFVGKVMSKIATERVFRIIKVIIFKNRHSVNSLYLSKNFISKIKCSRVCLQLARKWRVSERNPNELLEKTWFGLRNGALIYQKLRSRYDVYTITNTAHSRHGQIFKDIIDEFRRIARVQPIREETFWKFIWGQSLCQRLLNPSAPTDQIRFFFVLKHGLLGPGPT